VAEAGRSTLAGCMLDQIRRKAPISGSFNYQRMVFNSCCDSSPFGYPEIQLIRRSHAHDSAFDFIGQFVDQSPDTRPSWLYDGSNYFRAACTTATFVLCCD